MPLTDRDPIEPDAAQGERLDTSNSFIFVPSSGQPFLPPQPKSARTLTATDFCAGAVIEQMLRRAGLSTNEAAKALGITPNALRQYMKGRRSNPSFVWFLKIAQLCNTTVYIEYPDAP